MTTERQIVHHLTTEVGAIQISESENDVRMDFDNTATHVNMTTDVYRMHGIELARTAVFVHETDNMLVSHLTMDSTVDRYRNVVSLIFENEEGDVSRRTVVHLYVDPNVLKAAIEQMTSEHFRPIEEGETNEN